MRIFLSIIFLLVSLLGRSQDLASDLQLIQQQSKGGQEVVKFKGPLKMYHNHISDQILNDCIYEYSCSTFSQGAFDRFGIFKGLMMTCDRLMRCNRSTVAETSAFGFTRSGKLKEHWDEFEKAD